MNWFVSDFLAYWWSSAEPTEGFCRFSGFDFDGWRKSWGTNCGYPHSRQHTLTEQPVHPHSDKCSWWCWHRFQLPVISLHNKVCVCVYWMHSHFKGGGLQGFSVWLCDLNQFLQISVGYESELHRWSFSSFTVKSLEILLPWFCRVDWRLHLHIKPFKISLTIGALLLDRVMKLIY